MFFHNQLNLEPKTKVNFLFEITTKGKKILPFLNIEKKCFYANFLSPLINIINY